MFESCGYQILRDRILPDMKELENFEKNHGYWIGHPSHCSSYNVLNDAMAVADELQKECARMTGVDINCSFEPTSKLSLEAMGEVVDLITFGNEYILPCS